MRRNLRMFGRLAAFAVLVSWATTTVAQEETSLMVNGPALSDQGTMPPPADMPARAVTSFRAAEPVAAIRPEIDYRTHLSARRMLRRDPAVNLIMIAQNPADRCLYEIPLCIPACCEGAPSVEAECGRLGRGEVEYCWPCGFEAEVVFRARGGVEVHYRG